MSESLLRREAKRFIHTFPDALYKFIWNKIIVIVLAAFVSIGFALWLFLRQNPGWRQIGLETIIISILIGFVLLIVTSLRKRRIEGSLDNTRIEKPSEVSSVTFPGTEISGLDRRLASAETMLPTLARGEQPLWMRQEIERSDGIEPTIEINRYAVNKQVFDKATNTPIELLGYVADDRVFEAHMILVEFRYRPEAGTPPWVEINAQVRVIGSEGHELRPRYNAVWEAEDSYWQVFEPAELHTLIIGLIAVDEDKLFTYEHRMRENQSYEHELILSPICNSFIGRKFTILIDLAGKYKGRVIPISPSKPFEFEIDTVNSTINRKG